MLRRSHRRRKTRSLVLLLFCLPATTFAQSVPASSTQKLPLTLRQAVLLALKQNSQQIIALLQVQQSGRDSQIAPAPLLPQADLGLYVIPQYLRILQPYNAQQTAVFYLVDAIGLFLGVNSAVWIGVPRLGSENRGAARNLPADLAVFAQLAASNLSATERPLEIGESL
jgi:hypothetical protein